MAKPNEAEMRIKQGTDSHMANSSDPPPTTHHPSESDSVFCLLGIRPRMPGQAGRNGSGTLQRNEEIEVLLKDVFLHCAAVGFVRHAADPPG
ncbi:hypothetical protein SDJN03_20902, partial [Cucurbita argyrosperma subsp. sororia]